MMSSSPSRRTVLKHLGLAGAGVAVAAIPGWGHWEDNAQFTRAFTVT